MHGRQHFPGPPGRVLTPPIDAGILEGITREAVIELARHTGREVLEIPLTKHDVYIADECFLTGTAAEVVPVVKVDSRTIGEAAGPDHTRVDGAVSRPGARRTRNVERNSFRSEEARSEAPASERQSRRDTSATRKQSFPEVRSEAGASEREIKPELRNEATETIPKGL